MTRRDFAIRAATLGVLTSLPACWFQNVYSQINQYVPVALVAFDRIIEILIANNVDVSRLTNAVNMVKAALADIQSAILEYHDAHEHDKATLVQAISIALKIASHRLVEFWELLQIPNQQLARTVKLLLDVIISTLTAFIGQLAPGTPVASQRFLSGPKLRSIKEFRSDFNWILDHNGLSKYAI